MIKVKNTFKSICAMALATALLIAGLIYPASLDVYADGQLHVKLVGMDGVGDGFPGFTFELYKVGTLGREVHELDPAYADLGVKIPAADAFDPSKADGGSEWQETWMSSAASLANHIKHPADGETPASPIATFSGITPGKSITYDATRDDLYLLVGSTVEYDNAYYTPLPMFLWNVDAQGIDTVIKIKKTTKVFKHNLMKTWSDNNNAAGVRPAAIEVGIYYGSQLIDKVKLGGSHGEWTYSWKSEESGDTYCYIGTKDGQEITREFQPGANDKGWAVREFTSQSMITDSEAKAAAGNLAYYSPEYEVTSSDSVEAFIINNPYHDNGNPPPEPSKTKKVKTGDENKPLIWGGIAAIAAVLLIVVLVLKRRGNRDIDEDE